MASCSNSEFQGTYDIFLSFRGLDTRKKFTDHLYEALKREGFQTFRDDDGIERGENIKSELRKAIENSRMSIIVLSKNYPNSMACLREIQMILEYRKKKLDHVILPVFYEVDPLDIKERAKNLDFGKVTVEEVKGWSAALEEVATMAGMVSGNQSNGYEAKFIEEIIGVLKIKQVGKHLRVGDYLDLDENMRNLKKKLEYLTGQENDIYSEICSAERQPWKRRKKEVEVWLTDVQRFKDDVQRLELEVVGETNVFSRMWLGKDIVKNIQEVSELQEKGRDFNGLLIDELPAGRLLIPPTKDFVESTKSRNVERVWACLMADDVRQIGVYGMGGIGKTTIMKHIHNQLLEEKGKFDIVYWVTVSKAFNVTKLQSDIATALNLSLREDEEVTRRASQLYAVLSRQKRYVLILDDLWEPFALERVGIPEPMRSNGCKLVLTTRLLEVCRRMECTPVKLDLLTEEEALTLFLSKAVGNDTVLAPEVEEIAAKIAKQCACLPLAIVTLAGSLRGLKGTHEWRNALNELISSTEDANDDESEVFERLKFSYSRLGSKVLQDCFLYCSLYPEDHMIPVNELIEYWIAEELIVDMDSEEAQFDKGHAILGKLTSSCLLESFTNIHGMMEYVKLHDLIRDMALRISSPRFMVKAGERIKSIPYEHWSEDLERISLLHSRISELPVTPPICPRLTTLLLRRIHYLSNSFFTYMRCLEVLDLSNNHLNSLPESISNLENLHALILANSHVLMYVPSLAKLKALKEFKLTNSWIEKLPAGLEELVSLRKLDLSENERLETFPSWKLRRLSKLQHLRIDGTKVEVSAEDLLCLKQLKVVSVRFHYVQQLIRYVTSQQFQGLEKYCLTVGERHISYDPEKDPGKLDPGKKVYINSESVAFGSAVDQLVLPADINSFRLELPADINPLQHDGFHDPISLSAIPCFKDARDLRTCIVSGFVGLESIFSSSPFSKEGLISLGTVEDLDLEVLPRFRVLFDGIVPPHSIYFNLKVLYFSKCDAVKNIFPVQLLQNFPNLEQLCVWDCKNVEDIIVEKEEMSDRGNHQDYSNSISLPKLKVLYLGYLPKLKSIYNVLYLGYLPKLKSIYNGMMVCPSLQEVVVRNCWMVRRLPLSLHMDSDQATAPPFFKYIYGDETWWESLEWDDPLTKTILEPYLLDYLNYEDYEKDYLNYEDY
ncbi:disease resistance protein At4g27190-like [Rhododendron vialii]|uniref:disease resistance protein At4g27190-like n=1 Tax=Rhododendron vialii TaxID=182163 RepID=UPI00265DA9D7|nr:disease resistance protein At4g27190-like [Rhododendron vialii]